MSEFQTGLLLIGALAVAAVFGYNKWQEHRAGRAADESFKSRHPDVLVENAAVPVPRSAGRAAGDDSRIEPIVVSRSPVQAGSPGAAAVAIPDARVDYVIELTGPTQVNAALLAELWAAVEQRFPRR